MELRNQLFFFFFSKYTQNEIEEDEFTAAVRRRRRATATQEGEDPTLEEEEIDPDFPIADMKGHTLSEWVTTHRVRRHIRYRFNRFLTTFVDANGTPVYAERLRAICDGKKK